MEEQTGIYFNNQECEEQGENGKALNFGKLYCEGLSLLKICSVKGI